MKQYILWAYMNAVIDFFDSHTFPKFQMLMRLLCVPFTGK